MIGIYKITSPSGKIYIGQSIKVNKRFKRYKSLDCKEQPKLYRSLMKHGFDKHDFEIICECLVEELNEKERYYQDFYNSMDVGLNCVLTKTENKKAVVSDETIQKIRRIHLGRVDSDEIREKRTRSLTGLKRTPEQKKRMSESAKGRKMSDEMKAILYVANKGRVKTDEERRKLSISNTGKKLSEETKNKLSIINLNRSKEVQDKMNKSLLGRKVSDDTRKKMSISQKGKIVELRRGYVLAALKFRMRKVVCTTTNVVYDSVSDCARINGYKDSTLRAKLIGTNKNNTSFIFLKI